MHASQSSSCRILPFFPACRLLYFPPWRAFVFMQITLNGEHIDTTGQTLDELIEEQGLNPDAIVAEVNYELIKREFWQQHVLQDGDTVELLSFVGGG